MRRGLCRLFLFILRYPTNLQRKILSRLLSARPADKLGNRGGREMSMSRTRAAVESFRGRYGRLAMIFGRNGAKNSQGEILRRLCWFKRLRFGSLEKAEARRSVRTFARSRNMFGSGFAAT